MSKKVKSLIIAFVAILLLAGGLVALKLMKPKEDDTKTSSLSSQTETIDLIKEKPDDLESLTIKNEQDEYTIENVGEKKWKIKELSDFDQDTLKINTTISSVSNVSADRIIKENADNLKDYGLSEPKAEFVATFKGSKTYKIAIGDVSPDGQVLYALKDDGKTVYGLSSNALSNIHLKRYDYLDKTITESYDPNNSEQIPKLSYVSIERPNLEKPIVLEKYVKKESKENGYLPELEMSSPVKSMLNDKAIQTYVLGKFGMVADDIKAVNPTAEQLKEFGLDTPTSVYTVKYNDTDSFKITTGKAINDGAQYYAMKEGDSKVFILSAESVNWMNVAPKDLVSSIAIMPYIGDIKSVEVIADKKYDIQLTQPKEEDGEIISKVNGKEINIDNTKKFYQLLLMTYVQDLNNIKPEVKPSLSVKYIYLDGRVDLLEVYVLEDRTTVISLNGNFAFKGRAGFVDKVTKEAIKLEQNQEVDTDW